MSLARLRALPPANSLRRLVLYEAYEACTRFSPEGALLTYPTGGFGGPEVGPPHLLRLRRLSQEAQSVPVALLRTVQRMADGIELRDYSKSGLLRRASLERGEPLSRHHALRTNEIDG